MTILVTGATGLIGANVCRLLVERGDLVRALVRPASDATALAAIGVEVVPGDITSADDVDRAASGCAAIVNSAALLGGAHLDLDEQLAANHLGSLWCYDAAARVGGRVVELTTTPFLRSDVTLTEHPEVLPESRYARDAYAVSKGRAFVDGRTRAEAGEDICFVIPGGTFRPSPAVQRSMAATSYNRVLRGAIRGKVGAYPSFPVPWVRAEDVAAVVIAALDSGDPGVAYLAFGEGPATSTAAFLNLGCEAAGVEHRVAEVVISGDDAEARATYGETIFEMATRRVPDPFYDDGETRRALHPTPSSTADAVAETVAWFRREGLLSG